MDFSSRTALVFGGAKGIGRAGAEALAARGCDIVVADLDATSGERVVEHLQVLGRQALFVPVDVRDDDAVRAAVSTAEQAFGSLHVIVNSAGSPTPDEVPDAFEKNVDMFLLGVWRGLKHGVAALRRAGGGSIVNVASIAGITGSIGSAGYGPAKHGVVGLTRSAALRFAAERIRVNSVCPGYVATDMNTRLHQTPDGGADYINNYLRVPMGRWGRVEEIGSVIAFLASDDSSFITGQEIVVDGGLTAR